MLMKLFLMINLLIASTISPLSMLGIGGAAEEPEEENQTTKMVDAADMGFLNSKNRWHYFPIAIAC